ncbi:hypothetical protein FRZ67_10090 [Panacibacter ginsenosidivorans]|uniref:Clostripain n=1 Tax=Panacibacter ginsenosidivorans TaxID=1813871 RepID=A0A5B8V8F5_9BACT|nr:clostripain-related cysteine peptidase [Panacibacter ginsenosidivorans]QEC67622.1 hypothetical protein FRZ67_10090 [Panacibacter ginsenosidivorans]
MANSNPTHEWTIMIYMNVEPEGFEMSFKKNLQEICSIGSTSAIKIIIVADRNPNKKGRLSKNFLPKIYEIETKIGAIARKKVRKTIRRERLGSPQTLEDFLSFCKSRYPAKKYMLSFWDHGAGTAVAASPDPGSNRGGRQDALYTKEIFTAIKKTINQVDIIAFDACWMQMLENAYTLRACAKYLVASQNLASLQGFGYYMFLKHLSKNSSSSPLEAATLLIKSSYLKVTENVKAKTPEKLIKLFYHKIYDDKTFTLSCIKLDQIERFAEKINDLAAVFLKNSEKLFPHIQTARFLCLSYFDEEDPSGYNLKTIDLIYFLKKLLDSKFESDNDKKMFVPIAEQIVDIIEYAEICLIAYKEIGSVISDENATEKRWGAHGFSIFFPEHFFEWELYKKREGWYYEKDSNIQLLFAEKNKWKSFLYFYFQYVKKVTSKNW